MIKNKFKIGQIWNGNSDSPTYKYIIGITDLKVIFLEIPMNYRISNSYDFRTISNVECTYFNHFDAERNFFNIVKRASITHQGKKFAYDFEKEIFEEYVEEPEEPVKELPHKIIKK